MLLYFDANGLLPPGDYEMSFEELRRSALVARDDNRSETWDSAWREKLVGNLEVLTRQLWAAGVRDVYADGSFVEDKDHPNDIDGYFVCDLESLMTGELVRQLNLLDPHKVWTWDPASRKPYRGTAWSCIRMCQGSALAAASSTARATNWSFRPLSGNAGAAASPKAS